MQPNELHDLETLLARAEVSMRKMRAPAAMQRRIEDAVLAVGWLRANNGKRKL